jgi:predicted nucleic acid-binding protein
MSSGGSTVKNKSERIVICDAGPVVHLDELDCLDLLSDFEKVIVPERVRQEIEHVRQSALEKPWMSFTIIGRRSDFDSGLLTMVRTFMLDAGETEALSLMKENPHAIFLTDDASARLVAIQMGFGVHGTIGILVRAIRRGYRKPEEVLRVLSELPQKSTLYIKHSLLEEIILKVKHDFDL